MISRDQILRRIRYSKRVQYDKTPSRKEMITQGVHEPGSDAKEGRVAFLKSRLKERTEESRQPKGAGGMSGHELIFDHFLKKLGEHDPGRTIMHLNNFIDRNRLHREYDQHMRKEGFDIPGPSREASANSVSQQANLEGGNEHEVLSSMASFLDKTGKVAEAKKFLDEIKLGDGFSD